MSFSWSNMAQHSPTTRLITQLNRIGTQLSTTVSDLTALAAVVPTQIVQGASSIAIAAGNITVTVGSGKKLTFVGLPTADPHVVGQAWSNAGVVTISAG